MREGINPVSPEDDKKPEVNKPSAILLLVNCVSPPIIAKYNDRTCVRDVCAYPAFPREFLLLYESFTSDLKIDTLRQ